MWIRFLSNRSPYADSLDSLLRYNEVVGHPFVYGELLIGDRGGSRILLTQYEKLVQSTPVEHAEVVEFVIKRGLHGLGMSWIDVHLLASTVVDGIQIWTADERFLEVAKALEVAYSPQP